MTNFSLRRTARQWLAEGRAVMLIEVIEAQGSTPREAGARMLVSAGKALGTIGGGHLELQAIEHARAALASGDTSATEHRVALGPSLGQCCGGAVTLRTSRLSAELLDDSHWPLPAPRFHLQLYGAGHVGRAIVKLLADIESCRVTWIDERDAEFGEWADGDSLPPHIERVCVDEVQAEVRRAPPNAHYLVLTHSHALDLKIVEEVLKRGDSAYLGLIGSASKRARFAHRLAERGFDEALIQRIECPIGWPGIVGKEPAIVAVAVVARLLRC
jgi:xanthine dehydrogenase accessory factor